MQRRASLVQGLCATFALVFAGCAQPASGGGSGGSNGNGGSSSGNGGSNNSGGSNGSGGAPGGSTGSSGGNPGHGGSPGLAGNSRNRGCRAPASGDVVADFEEGTNQNVLQGSRQGWW